MNRLVLPPGWPRSHYEKEIADLMIRFFTRDVDQIKREINEMHRLSRMAVNTIFPTVQGFAISVGTTMAILRTWATAVDASGAPLHPEFRNACKHARELQLTLIAKCVSLRIYDARFAALLVANPETLMGWDANDFPVDSDASQILTHDGEFDIRCLQPRQPDGSKWQRPH